MAWHTPSLDFYLQVRKGRVRGHSSILMSGEYSNLSTSDSTIWPEGGLVTWPSAATQMTLSSSSTNDDEGSTGATNVMITGLDEDFNILTESVALDGQTGVTTTASFYRINKLQVVGAGSNGANEGNIYIGEGTITAGKPATVYNMIPVGANQSYGAFITIPRSTDYSMVYALSSASVDTMITQYVRPAGGLFYASGSTILNSARDIHIKGAPGLLAGTDYEIRAKTLSGSGIVTFYAEFVEVDERSG